MPGEARVVAALLDSLRSTEFESPRRQILTAWSDAELPEEPSENAVGRRQITTAAGVLRSYAVTGASLVELDERWRGSGFVRWSFAAGRPDSNEEAFTPELPSDAAEQVEALQSLVELLDRFVSADKRGS